MSATGGGSRTSGGSRARSLADVYKDLQAVGYKMGPPQLLHVINLCRAALGLRLWDAREEKLVKMCRDKGFASEAAFSQFFDETLPKEQHVFNQIIERLWQLKDQAAAGVAPSTMETVVEYWRQQSEVSLVGRIWLVLKVRPVQGVDELSDSDEDSDEESESTWIQAHYALYLCISTIASDNGVGVV